MEEKDFIKLFDYFLNIDESSIQHSAELIASSPVAGTDIGITIISQYFIRAFRVRPKKLDILARLFVETLKIKKGNQISKLPQKFISFVFSFTPISGLKTKIRGFYILRKLIKYGVYTEKEVVDYVISEIDDQENCKNYIFDCCCWAPEVSSVRPNLFDFVPYRLFDEMPFLQHFYENINDLKKDNWKYFNEIIENEAEPHSIVDIINRDDVDAIVNLAANNTFNFSMIIPSTIFEHRTIFHRKTTLLQAAAFAGAVKCAKYLLLNGVEVNEKDGFSYFTSQYAVCGGCIEIVRLLDQNGANFLGAAQLAVEYFQYDIYKWIISTKSEMIWKYDMFQRSSIHNAAISGNLRAFVDSLNNGEDINAVFDNMTPLILAVKCNSFEIVLSILNRDPTLIEHSRYMHLTLFQIAISYAKDEMVFFLMDKLPDWDHWGGSGKTTNDLVCAIENRRTSLFPKLIEKMKIAENPKRCDFLNIAINDCAFRPIKYMAEMGRDIFPIDYNLLPKNFNSLSMLISFLVKVGLIKENREGLPEWCQKRSVHFPTLIDIIKQKAKQQPDPMKLYNSNDDIKKSSDDTILDNEEEESQREIRLSDRISFDIDVDEIGSYEYEEEEEEL